MTVSIRPFQGFILNFDGLVNYVVIDNFKIVYFIELGNKIWDIQGGRFEGQMKVALTFWLFVCLRALKLKQLATMCSNNANCIYRMER